MARAEQPLKCPSAQPGMGDVQILGVISRDAEEPRLAYLNEAVPATPGTLELAAPLDVSQVFRLSARCEEKKCTHFDGSHCQLAVRIARLLPEVVDHLPPCNIRPDCRWFRQEGRAACMRCPQIVTGTNEADERWQEVAGGWPLPVLKDVARAQSAAELAARMRSAARFEDAARIWERVLTRVASPGAQLEARDRIADARWNAWELDRTPARAASARIAIGSFLALHPGQTKSDQARRRLAGLGR